jgi:fibronectin-binding autotransporter adhesin
VLVNGDILVEPDETFTVHLSNATNGAGIGTPDGTGTIQNDDIAQVVISQIYGGGNNTGATYKNDFIELFNRGTTTVDLAGWSVQQASAAGTSWSVTALCASGSCSITPGQYFLVKEGPSSPTVGADLPTANATGTSNLSVTSGKIALVSDSTALTGSGCPFGPSIVDFVGYGTTADCSENSTRAPAHSNTSADFREAGGCTDTNDNAADFFVAAPFPRNSASPTNNCSGAATPNLSIDDVTVTEGNSGTTTATFTVSLSAPAQGADVTFDIATADGTAATANSDYVAKSLTNQIIPTGQTSYTFTVTVNRDTSVEPDETFSVNVSNVIGANVTDGTGTGTIQNDDLPALSIDDVSATEGDNGTKTFSFHVTLTAPAPSTVTFDVATADGTATVADNDYVAKSLTGQTIAQGDSSYTFDVTVNGDENIEASESFFVNITNVSGVTLTDGQGQGTIVNDDSPILSINDVSHAEGDSGTTTFTFTVTSTLPAPAGGITFDIATSDGTAQDHNPTTEDNDYVAKSLTGQTIPAGQTTYTFDVTVNGDKLVEPDETFNVTISNVSGGGASIGDGTGSGTIQNDDTPNLVISQIYGGGNNSGATYKNDFIELFNRGTTTVDLAGWSVQQASATGTSWSVSALCPAGSCLITPGKYFLVKEGPSSPTVGADLPAADATGTSNLSVTSGKIALVSDSTALTGSGCPFGASIVDFVGYGTTADCSENSTRAPAHSNSSADFRKAGGCIDTNDNAADFFVSTPFPRNSSSPANNCSGAATTNLSINDVTVVEGNSGTTTATFTVSLSAPAQGTDVTFDIATADGAATTANNDYVSKSLTNQIIPAGQTAYTFTVTVNGDTTVEPDETFLVNVSNVVGANVTDGQGVGTIQNDDLPTISIDDVSVVEGDSGTTTANFTVCLSAPAPTGGVSFSGYSADGTTNPATAPSDYVAIVNGSGSISAGNSSTTVSVNVNGDTTDEPNETFFVNLSNPSNATIADGQGLGTIQNDDSPPTLSVSDVTQAEGNSGTSTFTFNVNLSAPAKAGGVSFTVNTADDTAAAGSDYVAIVNGAGSIPQGSSSTTVAVTVNGDTTFESSETFFVNLSNITGATVADGQGLGTITNDDTAPTIAIADASIVEGNSGTSIMTFTVTMTGTSQSNATVDYATADSSATVADDDYDNATGTLTFAPNDPPKTISVTIHGDTNAEGDEMFLVNLSNPGGATITDNQALGTIFLDDPFSVASLNTAYTENFDSLAQTGNSSTTPTAWTRAETGSSANTTYTANTGSSATGDTYSYGSTTSPSDRALGGLRTGTLVPTIGAFYQNDTGSTVNALQISYTGEEWRLGSASKTDQLDFQYSTDATTLATGTWTDVNALDFTTPNTTTTGSKDGNAVGNRTAISSTITGLSIAPGATFWIRWTDFDATGSDDGLAVDDFSITALNQPTLSIDDVTQAEANSGDSTFNFTVHLSQAAPAGGVTFNFSTADGTATVANNDYAAVVNGNGSISAGNTQTTVSVTVHGDMTSETNETFFVNLSNATNAVIGDGQAVGTITNDDGAAPVTKLVISQVYGGGGNTGATYKNDFIEVFNAGNTTVDFAVTPYSVQYTAATGSFGTSKTDISSGTVAPGQYFLIKEFGPASPAGVDLPTPDATGTINLDANSGKVALVLGTTLLSGTCPGDDGVAPFNPSGNGVVDFLGYGFGTSSSNPNCFEGSARATTASATANARSIMRTASCTDTNDKAADFTYTNSTGTSPPVARNKSTTIPPCL